MTDMAKNTGRPQTQQNGPGGQGPANRGPGGYGSANRGPGGRGPGGRGPGGRGPGGRGPGGRGPGGRGPSGPGQDRDMVDMQETVININRVAKVVKGGRRFSFNALVTVGDGKGKVGVALGKANEIADAIRKASENARAKQITVPIIDDTTPFLVEGRYGASRVVLKPAAPGTGVIAAGAVRAILEATGVKNILTKQLGSKNPHNVWKATMDGLKQLRSVEEIAAKRGITVPEVFGLPKREAKPETPAETPVETPAEAPAEAAAETPSKEADDNE